MNIWGAKHLSDLDAQHSTRHAMAAICGDCEKQVEASVSWSGGNQAAALISLLCLPHTEAGAIGMMKHLLTVTRRVAPLSRPTLPAKTGASIRFQGMGCSSPRCYPRKFSKEECLDQTDSVANRRVARQLFPEAVVYVCRARRNSASTCQDRFVVIRKQVGVSRLIHHIGP